MESFLCNIRFLQAIVSLYSRPNASSTSILSICCILANLPQLFIHLILDLLVFLTSFSTSRLAVDLVILWCFAVGSVLLLYTIRSTSVSTRCLLCSCCAVAKVILVILDWGMFWITVAMSLQTLKHSPMGALAGRSQLIGRGLLGVNILLNLCQCGCFQEWVGFLNARKYHLHCTLYL